MPRNVASLLEKSSGVLDVSVDRWLATRPAKRAALLAIFCGSLFIVVNYRTTYADGIAQALTPVMMCREGSVCLDTYRPYYEKLQKAGGSELSFTLVDGHLYPRNSVYVCLLVTPLYLPPVLAGWPTEDTGFWIGWSSLSGAIVTGAALGMMYLTGRRYGNESSAGFCLLFAFGTCLWTLVGRCIYDHLAIVCVAGLVWWLEDFPLRPGRAFWVSFLAGAAVCMRPCVVVLLFPLGIFLFFWPGMLANAQARLAALAGILLVPLSNAWLNDQLFGNWYTTGYPKELVTDWGNPFWEGFTGLIVSPNSGLLAQSPFMLMAFLGAWEAWTARILAEKALLRVYTLCILAFWIMFSFRNEWHGGVHFASRYFCEGYPLCLPLALVGWRRIGQQRWARVGIVAAGAWSVLFQAANIATFDEILAKYGSPPNSPWAPSELFIVQHAREYGLLASAAAIASTLALLSICAAAVLYTLRPFLDDPALVSKETS